MREIKFRAWDRRTRTMKYPVPYDDGNGECPESLKEKVCPATLKDDNGHTSAISDVLMSNNDDQIYVAMQFTGLKDSTGKEIYEGDIVEFKYADFSSGEITPDNTVKYLPIEYFSGGFQIVDKKDEQFYSIADRPSSLIIVGNVHENPELLKDQK